MLIRTFPKIIVFIGPLLILGYMCFIAFSGESKASQAINWSKGASKGDEDGSSRVQEQEALSTAFDLDTTTSVVAQDPTTSVIPQIPTSSEVPQVLPPPTQQSLSPPGFKVESNGDVIVDSSVYTEVFSVSTADRKFFSVDFGPGYPTINPNIIPHPQKHDTWIIVAQREKGGTKDAIFEEAVCNAVFQPNGSLSCSSPPTILPVAPTFSNNCHGKLAHFTFNVGPHDMRVSYGPDAPFSIYGSQSGHTCFGLFVQDFRALIDDFGLESLTASIFANAAELQRPLPWHEVEKNWFIFWDTHSQAYVHHDVEPKRVFAQLSPDGSVGPDLSPLAAASDDACMAKYMPKLAPENENVHQGTNSLSITMCKRSEADCLPTDDNTFIFTIFQHKKYHSYHGVYEPYVMLFRRNSPFNIHAISSKPIWIHGRGPLTKDSGSKIWRGHEDLLPKDHSEMFYITSMSWKSHGQKYHGYVDDVLFLGFGIEDSRTAAIDVRAGDLLKDLGLCMGVGV